MSSIKSDIDKRIEEMEKLIGATDDLQTKVIREMTLAVLVAAREIKNFEMKVKISPWG